jgi:hypothetical protein
VRVVGLLVGVPLRVADVVVAVTRLVVVVVAEDGGRDVVDARVVEQGGQVRMRVHERHEHRALHVVVRPPAGRPDLLERVSDRADLGREQPRKLEEPERAIDAQLLLGQTQRVTSRAK